MTMKIFATVFLLVANVAPLVTAKGDKTNAEVSFVGWWEGSDPRVGGTLAQRSIIPVPGEKNLYSITGRQEFFELCSFKPGVFLGTGYVDDKGVLQMKVDLTCFDPANGGNAEEPVRSDVTISYTPLTEHIIAEVPVFRPNDPTYFQRLSRDYEGLV